MFGSITAKIAAGLALIIVLMGSLGLWYFDYSQKKIVALSESVTSLTSAVKTQEETIAAQSAAAARQRTQSVELQRRLGDAETSRRDVENRLRQLNLTAAARVNRAATEQQINQDTLRAFNDLQELTRPRDRPTSTVVGASTGITPPTNIQPPPSPPVTGPAR